MCFHSRVELFTPHYNCFKMKIIYCHWVGFFLNSNLWTCCSFWKTIIIQDYMRCFFINIWSEKIRIPLISMFWNWRIWFDMRWNHVTKEWGKVLRWGIPKINNLAYLGLGPCPLFWKCLSYVGFTCHKTYDEF